jgi:hypothetical protein
MEGAKLCHLRDLQKACATLEGDDFKTWVQDKKAWYAPLERKDKSKNKQFNKSKKAEVSISSDSEDEDEHAHNKTARPAARGSMELGRGCTRIIPAETRPNLCITTLISKDLVHHVRWSEEVFKSYTTSDLRICAADFKQMETIVDRNVSGAPAFAACMRWTVSVHCLCTSSRLHLPPCTTPPVPVGGTAAPVCILNGCIGCRHWTTCDQCAWRH